MMRIFLINLHHMNKYYSINKLAELAQVSIRTLHHYDAINLLKPHHRTHKNHRRYTEDDLLRLQQIAMFKFIGFSLDEIKGIFSKNNFNIYAALQSQHKTLAEQITKIKKISQLINYMTVQYDARQPIDWTNVIEIMHLLKNNIAETKNWYKNFLSQSEQQQYDLHGLKNFSKWKAILMEFQDNSHDDPTSDKSKKLMEKLLNMAYQYYGDKPDFIFKLWEAFKAGIIPKQLVIKEELISYIEKTFVAYKQTESL